MDVDVIKCLDCFIIKSTAYIIKALNYGIECKLDEIIKKTKKAYNYLKVATSNCTLNNTIQTKIKRFVRLNCIDCG
jgi:hypothetical protein